MDSDFKIRKMTEEEIVNVAVKWAEEEGWNPGLHDAHCFYNADKNGYFIGMLGDEPIACISAVAYGNNFGFLGFYIVKKEYRGKGYGIQIWNTAMNYLRGYNVGLDGVIEQQPNYRKSGFKLAYKNIRYEGKSFRTNDLFTGITDLKNIPFNELIRYDSQLFPAERFAFLKCWLEMPESYSLAAVSDEKICGYTVIRKCVNGYKTGPLFADSKETALKLFISINNKIPEGTPIYLDTPAINTNATDIAEKFGMVQVFETARMYTKTFPGIDTSKIFGVTTFELG